METIEELKKDLERLTIKHIWKFTGYFFSVLFFILFFEYQERTLLSVILQTVNMISLLISCIAFNIFAKEVLRVKKRIRDYESR